MAILIAGRSDSLTTDLATALAAGIARAGGSVVELALHSTPSECLADGQRLCCIVLHGSESGLHVGDPDRSEPVSCDWWQEFGGVCDALLVACFGVKAALVHDLPDAFCGLVTYSGDELWYFRLTSRAAKRWSDLYERIGAALAEEGLSTAAMKEAVKNAHIRAIGEIQADLNENQGDLLVQLQMKEHEHRIVEVVSRGGRRT